MNFGHLMVWDVCVAVGSPFVHVLFCAHEIKLKRASVPEGSNTELAISKGLGLKSHQMYR